MMQNKGKIYVKKFIILLFWLGVWQILAMCVDNFLLVVTPLQALRALLTLAGQVEFWRSAFDSLWRIAFGFLLGAVLALLLAAISYRYPLAEEVLRPFMVFCKAVPVAVFAVLLLIWWGSSMLAVAICFLVVFPNIYLNTLEGLKSADRGLLEMAEVFRLPLGTQFFYIYRPALKPFLLSAFQLSLGMCWKSGVAAEVIGTPSHSIGGALYLAKIYLDTADLFAWTAVIVVLSVFFEKIIFYGIEVFFRWEPACKELGLPLGRLVCASNANKVLTDFLRSGVYDRRRPLHRTLSPSMDILVSSNLERLLYHVTGSDTEVAGLMKSLAENGSYTVRPETLAAIQETFACGWSSEKEVAGEIRARYEQDGYLCDTHTAVAFHVAAQKKRSGVPMVVLSTASPFKFPRSVLEALGRTAPENDFEAMQQLEAATGHAAPASLAALRQKAERFDTVIDPAQIAEVALGYQA